MLLCRADRYVFTDVNHREPESVVVTFSMLVAKQIEVARLKRRSYKKCASSLMMQLSGWISCRSAFQHVYKDILRPLRKRQPSSAIACGAEYLDRLLFKSRSSFEYATVTIITCDTTTSHDNRCLMITAFSTSSACAKSWTMLTTWCLCLFWGLAHGMTNEEVKSLRYVEQ